MKPDKTYRRITRRRLEAALQVRVRGARPRVAPLMDAVPPEVIDLETSPFQARFPELAARINRRG